RRVHLGVVAVGPARRIVGTTALSLVFMMFNPTKWTHHFGVYAGIAAALAGLTAVLVGPRVLRSPRNRTLFAAAVLFVLAVSFESKNAWWYVSSFGIPWGGKAPELFGIKLATVFLVLAAAALVAALWFHCREPYVRPRSADTPTSSSRVVALVGAPLTLAVALLVVFQVASLAAGVVNQYPAYSVGLANTRAMAGHPCNLADDVLVEADPNAGMLQPIAPGPDPLGAVTRVNFTPDGLPTDLSSTQQASEDLIGNPGSKSAGNSAGTGGGTRATAGVNGSHMVLPFGLDPATTPVLGSYQTGDMAPAKAVSTWYRLPARSGSAPLLAVAAAGQVTDTNLQIEYGSETSGAYQPMGRASLIDVGPAPSWRTLRLP
ncbi:arabinosyltransferase, partial [Rhodococcus sp. D2-41]|uniref:arabinosyltransferase C-terminal domain-containing protein n=1 Tax=Speluncibacter jeojiensis TaxID=2710754 RepID=UPI00240F2815